MSKGNLITNGGKGRNFPFQFNSLLAQGEIITALIALGTPTTRTPSFVTIAGASGPTTIPAGAKSVTFYNGGPTNVTIDGGTLLPGFSASYSAGGVDILAAITYQTLATGILTITKIV